MDYIIASTVVTDEIRFANGKTVSRKAGGAGIYALCGIRLWCDSVMPVTGVGGDYDEFFGEWYRKNGISMDGLIVKDDITPYNVIQYYADEERSEVPLYGVDHYRKMEVTPEELEPYFKKAKGIYIFRNHSSEFWKRILPMLNERRASVMWEIASDSTCSECLEDVRRIAGKVDIFSINLTEARNLFVVESLEEIIERLQGWKVKLIFLRRGSKGAVMITPEKIVFVPTVDKVNVVDPTGGGNGSSGAVLFGWCNGRSLRECGLMGSISAAMCIEQYGVPEVIDREKREHAEKLLKKMKQDFEV